MAKTKVKEEVKKWEQELNMETEKLIRLMRL